MKYLILLSLLFCVGCSGVKNSDVYCLRGLGEVFSNGLDILSNDLKKEKISSISLSWTEWNQIIKAEKGEHPLFLIGHSYGADNAVQTAYSLRDKGITVDYLFLFDATDPKPIPNNVLNCTHWYIETIASDAAPTVFPGNPVSLEVGNIVTKLENKKVSGTHFNIDSNNTITQFIKQTIYSYYH